MKIGVMLSDLVQSLFKKPVTEMYPTERREPSNHLRAQLLWNPAKCTGCNLCVKDCPANAIELITLDKKNKRFVMRYHADRCIFCAQCVQTCRFSCLEMSQTQWELAALHKEPFTIYYGDHADIEAILENQLVPGATQPVGQPT
jgi:formate hydrogenlyase subunit 6/NADH:ubiquinone oxidoreductase subunit I